MKNPLRNGRIIATDCSIKTYLASKGGQGEPAILSRSDLVEISDCPERWRNGHRGNPDKRTPSTDFGSLLDCLLLQPHKVAEYYMQPPATYETKKGETKDWSWHSPTCREWRDEQRAKGFEVCADGDLIEAREAIASLAKDPQTVRLIENSTHQVFALAEYHDKETGIVVCVKVLSDIVPDGADTIFGKCILDLKTAVSAHPRKWKKAVFENDYHVQAALGLDVHNAIKGGPEREDFRHLIVENFRPWQTARRYLDPQFIELGREKYLTALRTYCANMESGNWEGYRDATQIEIGGYECVSPDPYMVTQSIMQAPPVKDPDWMSDKPSRSCTSATV